MRQQVKVFFDQYEERLNKGLKGEVDVDATVNAFAENFVEASPTGTIAGRNDDRFSQSVPKGIEFYREIGVKSMKMTHIDVVELNEFHVMATVHWNCRYVKKDGNTGLIEFDVIYMLQQLAEEPKIFAYITGDEQLALKEHGLV